MADLGSAIFIFEEKEMKCQIFPFFFNNKLAAESRNTAL